MEEFVSIPREIKRDEIYISPKDVSKELLAETRVKVETEIRTYENSLLTKRLIWDKEKLKDGQAEYKLRVGIYLNNFHFKLIDNRKPMYSSLAEALEDLSISESEFSEENRLFSLGPKPDMTYREWRVAIGETNNLDKHSQRRLDQSNKDFYEAFDAAMEAENVNIEDINKEYEKGDMLEANNFLLGVYIRLEASGYNHYDLTV